MSKRSKGAFVLSGIATLAFMLAHHTGTGVAGSERYLDEVFENVTVNNNVAYGEAIDEFGQPQTLLMNVYQPEGDTDPARPVVVVIHGGGFTDGGRNASNVVELSGRLARRGYVAATITYRLREAGFPEEDRPEVIRDAQHDAQAAIRWFRSHAAEYDLDPDRISIAGFSAGAATSLAAAYNSDDPGDSGNPGFTSDVSVVIDISGGVDVSAIDAGEPPVLVIHGTADSTAPYSYALDIVERAGEVGVTVEFHPLEGKPHAKFDAHMDSITDWSAQFLYNYVVLDEPPLTATPSPTRTRTPTPTRTPTRAAGQEPGNVNCQGGINSIDAALLLQYGAGLVASLSCIANADVNGDGHVNSIDAALVLQYVAGLLHNLPP
jgi:acetyl esterase/lipase